MYVDVIATDQVERMESNMEKSFLQAFLDENPDSSVDEIATFAKSRTVEQLSSTSKHGVKSSGETFGRIYEMSKCQQEKQNLSHYKCFVRGNECATMFDIYSYKLLCAIAHQSEKRIQFGIISHVFRDIRELERPDPEASDRIGEYKKSTIPAHASSVSNAQSALSALEGVKVAPPAVESDTSKRGRGRDRANVLESERRSKCRRLLEEDQADREYNSCQRHATCVCARYLCFLTKVGRRRYSANITTHLIGRRRLGAASDLYPLPNFYPWH